MAKHAFLRRHTMKKIIIALCALCALSAAAFAKPAKAPKLGGWKDIAKIADKNDLEVVENYKDWYVAKSSDGKEFAFYAIKDYADLKVTLAMACIDGEVYSRTTCVDKESSAPLPIFALGENDEKCIVVNADSLSVYYKEEGIVMWTEECKAQRSKLLAELSQKYGLIAPQK